MNNAVTVYLMLYENISIEKTLKGVNANGR